ncbi:MAG: cupin domain-containing protein [Pseudomonadota bacterium]
MAQATTKTKAHREFYRIDLEGGWSQIEGYPEGMVYRTLADDLDDAARTGSRTRLIRWPAGSVLPEAVIHETAEEVYVLEGDLVVTDAATGRETAFPAHSYACRPGHVWHGPFRTETGCLLLEIHAYPAGESGG